MKIIHRYLVVEFLWSLAYCLALFMILFVVIDAFNNLEDFLKNNVPIEIIGSFYWYSLPSIFVFVIPIATIVALLYAVGNLSQHNEIVAMKSSGMSTSKLVRPYVLIGILISCFIFFVNESVIPQSTITSKSIKEGLIEKGKKNFEERSIKDVTLVGKDGAIIYSREYEIASKTLYEVVILEENKNQSVKSKLTATKAKFEDGQWNFEHVMKYEINRRGEMIGEPLMVDKMTIHLPQSPEDFTNNLSDASLMNAKELKGYVSSLKNSSSKLARRLLVDWHYKFAVPFTGLILILVGAPLALGSHRRGIFVGVSVSLILVVLFYGLFSVFLAFGKAGILSPWVAAWSSNIGFGLAGLYLIKKSN